MISLTVLYILGSVAVVSILSFLGVLTLSFHDRLLKKLFAFLIPLAIGALLGDAFFHLLPESFEEGLDPVTIGWLVLAGLFLSFLFEKILRWHHHHSEDEDRSEEERALKGSRHLGPLILFSDGVHNFIDGVLIAISYMAGIEVGIATTIAIILHEIPQEVGDFSVLIYAGYSRGKALFYNFLSALTAIIGALMVLGLGSLPQEAIGIIIPFGAGIFIYVASSDLVPELHRNRGYRNVFLEFSGVGLGILAMYFLLFLE